MGRDTDAPTAGGVDANASKKHLYELAAKLEIKGRSSMTKDELVAALQRGQRPGVPGPALGVETADSREGGRERSSAFRTTTTATVRSRDAGLVDRSP